MSNLEIEKTAGAHGITGTLGYDPYSDLSPPNRGEHWKILTNQRDHPMSEFDGTYDVDRFYGDQDLTDWFRETHHAHVFARIRYESHGPYGQFLIDETFGPEEVITKAWSCEAIALITKQNAEKLGGSEQAFRFLKSILEAHSDWAHGQVYRYTITDHRGKQLETEGLIYGFENARDRMTDALAEHEDDAQAEILASNEWAARDVITVDPVPGAIGAAT